MDEEEAIEELEKAEDKSKRNLLLLLLLLLKNSKPRQVVARSVARELVQVRETGATIALKRFGDASQKDIFPVSKKGLGTIASNITKAAESAKASTNSVSEAIKIIKPHIDRAAETEVFVGHNTQVIKQAQKDNQKVRWDATLDSKVCEACRSRNGNVYLVDELIDPPPKHARCRCILIPVD